MSIIENIKDTFSGHNFEDPDPPTQEALDPAPIELVPYDEVPVTVSAGGVVRDSGVYRTPKGHTATLVKGKRAPPARGGGPWTQVFDTNPNDKPSRKRPEPTRITTQTGEPTPFETAKTRS